MANGPRPGRSSRPHRPPPPTVAEKRIPESYIVILQPTVTPYEMLSSVLKGFKPTFTYGSIFTGFAVDRVPMHKADEVSEGEGAQRARVLGLLLGTPPPRKLSVPFACGMWFGCHGRGFKTLMQNKSHPGSELLDFLDTHGRRKAAIRYEPRGIQARFGCQAAINSGEVRKDVESRSEGS